MAKWALYLISVASLCFAFPEIQQHPEEHADFHYFAVELHGHDDEQPTPSQLWTIPAMLFQRNNIENNDFDSRARRLQADLAGMEVVGRIGSLEGHYLIRVPKTDLSHDFVHAERLQSHGHVKWALVQKPRVKLFKRTLDIAQVDQIIANLSIADPAFDRQWHLVNRDLRSADINVTGVWQMGITGTNAVAAIIDDGVDLYHDDLKDNFGSWDFNAKSAIPNPKLTEDFHGTRCAGEVAASRNSACGVGVAYNAKVAGIRILGGPITDVDEALALNFAFQKNQVYSCSWGPSDDGQHVDGPNELVTNAFLNGIKKGRGGLGSIFVFATGNGGIYDDNCNYDGYTNSIYGISVGAIDRNNNHPAYSEECSAHLTVTYSSAYGGWASKDMIYTTDVSTPNSRSTCTSNHGGTSAAAPIVVGIIALVLGRRPDLSWRDMQHLVFLGSVPVNIEDPSWEKSGSGKNYSHKFGYGKLDAYQIVLASTTWKVVRRQVRCQSTLDSSVYAIPHDFTGLNVTFKVSQDFLDKCYFDRLEHVTVTVTVVHGRRGNLRMNLISPNNVISRIGTPRRSDRSPDGFKNWTFSSVKHWNEQPQGTWTLQIIDAADPSYSGELRGWQITLWGEISSNGPDELEPFAGTSSGANGIAAAVILCVILFSAIGMLWLKRRGRIRKYETFDMSDNVNEAFDPESASHYDRAGDT